MSNFRKQNPENYSTTNGTNRNSGYVDFNQFITQHNVNAPLGGGYPATQFASPTASSDFYGYAGPMQYPYQTNFNFGSGFMPPPVASSNTFASSSSLLPTAAEFVPRFSTLNLHDFGSDIVAPSTTNGILQNEAAAEGQIQCYEHMPPPSFTTPTKKTNITGAIRKDRSSRNYDNNRNSHQDSYYRGNGYYNSRQTRTNNRQENGTRNSNKRRENWRNYRQDIDGRDLSDSSEKKSPKASKNGTSTNQKSNTHSKCENISQREKLIKEIEGRKLECLVCVEQIKPHHTIWSCGNCYHILHLNCIIKWALKSQSEDGWRCPACQNISKIIPKDSFCFCGKTKNPQYNRNDVAHSCGEVCGRREGCDHTCTLLCHPGPCPACQATVTRFCGCGKTSLMTQCCIREDFSCGEKCEKPLNCELHTCQQICHHSKCSDCEEKVDHKCYCGKHEKQVACTRETNDKRVFSCGKVCGRALACGKHSCKDACHAGTCRSCKLTPDMVTSCPCGKMSILEGQRTSCLDPVPVCTAICGRTLKCGPPVSPHHCISKCHTGPCPPCNKQTAVRCRCGHMDQMIKCRQLSTRADDARCKKRCTKKRNCGKHKCNQECCIDIDHVCPLPCNYSLSCGKHKCDQTCHRGNCAPCYRSSFEELYCECGANVIYPPVACGTKKPACDKPCRRQHVCDHPVQHTCHSAPTCPPCIIFTTQFCYGGHEQRKTIPCSQQSFSCGLSCNKELPCGRHKCIKACHNGPCQTEDEICKQNCKTSRQLCGHPCNAPCHEGECPDTPCKENVEVTCECANRKQTRSCQDFSSDFRRIATSQLASSMQEMQRGNLVELSDILGPMKMSTNNKTLECTDECKILERNRRLAIGLQIRNPDLQSKLLTRYSDFIRGWAKKDMQLVKMIHDKLTELVKLSKDSKQRSRSHSFPTMNKEKRQLVHEMCGMFGVDSVAYDAEPNRNVVATAYKERSWLPAMSIMEVMQRESGQRRPPGPTANAWRR